MASPEHSNPPSIYSELFVGFAGMAAARGTITYGPLESSLEPGKDGTRMPDGEMAFGFDYAVNTEDLPPIIRELGIDKRGTSNIKRNR
jgi:hypothetical protein